MDRWPASELAAVKRAVVERAVALGASAVRVTPATQDTAARTAMREAFARGDFARWRYDHAYAERATNARSLLEGARSVICIAVSYATPAPADRPLRGRVSNYAWSTDYHRRMQHLLREVGEVVDRFAGAPVTAIACDTKPLAERAYAARAGLGWTGKHTMLIAPGAGGSFVFLGEIVTTIEIPADEPLKKQCGSCARCVTSCPTGALRGDYTIDATRCISDLTQRTDAIPRPLRPLIGTWVWGCDICQAVCPPNARERVAVRAENAPLSQASSAPDLIALLQLRSGEFKRVFAPTAMGWRGAAVLRRNAAVALGNALDRAAVPALARALKADPHPMVRGHAAWALGRIGSRGAVQALRAAGELEHDTSVLEEIGAALEPFSAVSALEFA